MKQMFNIEHHAIDLGAQGQDVAVAVHRVAIDDHEAVLLAEGLEQLAQGLGGQTLAVLLAAAQGHLQQGAGRPSLRGAVAQGLAQAAVLRRIHGDLQAMPGDLAKAIAAVND